MTLQPLTNERLNYYKIASVVLHEFPKALRQAFKTRWDNTFGHLPGFQPWDDSVAVRNLFLATEGGSIKVPTHLSYDSWNCSALFQATIFSKSFSMPDGRGHHRTLADLFARPLVHSPGIFHTSVISSTGNEAETFTLAINQLRILRNYFYHMCTNDMHKATFDQYIQLTKLAFQALNVSLSSLDTIESLSEADFPMEKIREMELDRTRGLQAEYELLFQFHKEGMEKLRSSIEQSNQAGEKDATLAAKLKQKIDDITTKTTKQGKSAAIVCLKDYYF